MSQEVLSLIGILLSLVFYVYAAVKGWHLLFIAICSTIIVALFSGMDVVTAVTGTFATGMAGFWGKYMIMFIGGSLFAKLMGDSGAAFRIADALKHMCYLSKNPTTQRVLAVLTIPMINCILTYGGVTSLIVVFLMVTIARRLFEDLNIPWKLYGFAVLGSATFTVGLLPGSPQPTNLIPMEYLGTQPTAGALLGIVGAVVQIGLSVIFLVYEVRRTAKVGEGFLPTGANIVKEIIPDIEIPKYNLLLCLLPCVVLLVCLNVIDIGIGPSLAAGCLTCYVLFFKEFKRKKCIKNTVAEGIMRGVSTLTLMSSCSGFGAVIGEASGYMYVISALHSIPGPAPFKVWLAVNIAAGITGSSSGGLSIVLNNLGDYFTSLGIPNAALHRLISASSIGLDTLPHSSGVVNACAVSKMTHKELYKYYFMISVVFTNVAALVIALLISLGIGV